MLIFYSTPWGPWAFSDSAAYLSSARNLIAGRGFGYFNPDGSLVPFTYYPPFYPLTLATSGLLGANLVNGARLLDIVLFVLLILVLGWTTYRYTCLPWMAFAVSVLILVSPVLVDAYSSIMSEPLFIFLGFSGLAAFLWYLRGNRRLSLFVASLATGLAMLTRYIGFAFFITGVLAILFLSGRRLKDRLFDTLLFSIIAVLPTFASQVWVYLVSAHVAGRSFGLNSSFLILARDFTNQLAGVINGWLPLSTHGEAVLPPLARLMGVSIIGLALFGFSWLRLCDQPGYISLLRFNSLMLVFCVVYPISLGLSYILSSPPVAINNRMLSPLLPALFALGCGLLTGVVKSFRSRLWVRLAWVGIVLAVLIISIPKTWHLASGYHQTGAGYTAKIWHDSQVFAPLQQLPPGIQVISNDPALMLFYLNRFPYDISDNLGWIPSPSAPMFGSGPGKIQAIFKAGAAMVIFMPSWQATFGNHAQSKLAQFTNGLNQVYSSPEFDIYYFPSGIRALSGSFQAREEPSG